MDEAGKGVKHYDTGEATWCGRAAEHGLQRRGPTLVPYVVAAGTDFNLRHDWNSLLDHPGGPPVTVRTAERWPPADVLTEYLHDFAQVQEDGKGVPPPTPLLTKLFC